MARRREDTKIYFIGVSSALCVRCKNKMKNKELLQWNLQREIRTRSGTLLVTILSPPSPRWLFSAAESSARVGRSATENLEPRAN